MTRKKYSTTISANIVTPDGDTIGERITRQIPAMLNEGKPIALLGDGR